MERRVKFEQKYAEPRYGVSDTWKGDSKLVCNEKFKN